MRKNWGNCREFQCKEGPERKKGYVNGSIDGVLFGIQGNEDGNNRTDKDQKKVELTTSLTGVLLQYKYKLFRNCITYVEETWKSFRVVVCFIC